VVRGTLRVNGSEAIREAEVALFDRAGESIRIDEAGDASGKMGHLS
jgi:redox-sensitive bicupin YhaK (pirin superfamily)